MSVTKIRLWQLDCAGATACGLATLVVYLLGVKPSVEAKANAAAVTSEMLERSGRAQELEEKVAEEKNLLAELRKQAEAAAVELRPLDRLNTQIAAITSLAEEAGLTVEAIVPGIPESGKRFTRVPIRLSGAGEFPAATKFMAMLHERHRDTGVSGFSLLGRPLERSAKPAFEMGLVWHAASDGITGGSGNAGAADGENTKSK